MARGTHLSESPSSRVCLDRRNHRCQPTRCRLDAPSRVCLPPAYIIAPPHLVLTPPSSHNRKPGSQGLPHLSPNIDAVRCVLASPCFLMHVRLGTRFPSPLRAPIASTAGRAPLSTFLTGRGNARPQARSCRSSMTPTWRSAAGSTVWASLWVASRDAAVRASDVGEPLVPL
jgi:hypothetical protein